MKTVRISEYVTAIAAASVAVAIPSRMATRMIATTSNPGSDATNARRTAPQPGNFSTLETPSALLGKPNLTAW